MPQPPLWLEQLVGNMLMLPRDMTAEISDLVAYYRRRWLLGGPLLSLMLAVICLVFATGLIATFLLLSNLMLLGLAVITQVMAFWPLIAGFWEGLRHD